jgi:8-oxo-dGTP pyrophosphatase MutT (NUDIX family)
MDKNLIEKAGGIVISNSKPTKVVMLFRVENDDWSFPKGHVESGETFEEAALREVEEETGLIGTIISKLPILEYNHASEKHVNVHMYAMKCSEEDNFKLEHKRDKVVWVPLAEVSKKLTYENLSSYFSKIEPVIRKLSAESDF